MSKPSEHILSTVSIFVLGGPFNQKSYLGPIPLSDSNTFPRRPSYTVSKDRRRAASMCNIAFSPWTVRIEHPGSVPLPFPTYLPSTSVPPHTWCGLDQNCL